MAMQNSVINLTDEDRFMANNICQYTGNSRKPQVDHSLRHHGCVCVCVSTTVLTGTSSHTVASLSLLTPVGKNVYFLGPHSNPNVVTLQILPGNLFIQRSRWRCMCLLHIHFNQFTLRKSVSMGLHSYVSYTNKIMEMGDLSVYCTMCGVSTVTGDLLTMVHSTDWYL